MDAK
jgi:hypothetical protein